MGMKIPQSASSLQGEWLGNACPVLPEGEHMVWHEDRQQEICEARDRYGFGGRIICLVWGKCLIYIPSGKGKGWCDIMTEKYFFGISGSSLLESSRMRAKAEERDIRLPRARENGYRNMN